MAMKKLFNYKTWSIPQRNNIDICFTTLQMIQRFLSYSRYLFISVYVDHNNKKWLSKYHLTLCLTETPKSHYNIILPSISMSSEWSLPFRFSSQNILHISHTSHAPSTSSQMFKI